MIVRCHEYHVPVQAPAKDKERDPDPHGEQLARTEDPLGEAAKLVQRLRTHSGDRLKTHELAFEVQEPITYSREPVKVGTRIAEKRDKAMDS